MKYFLPLGVLLLLAGCNAPQEQRADSEAQARNETAAPPVTTTHSSVVSSEQVDAARNEATSVSPQLVKQTETSPAMLYQKCAACHGSHAEKSALNQSAVIGEWDARRIVSSIVGYQEGTYGGAMKTLMQNQVKDLSRAQIEALAEYIANLYVKTH